MHVAATPDKLEQLDHAVSALARAAASADARDLRGLYIQIDVPDKRLGCGGDGATPRAFLSNSGNSR